MRMNSHGVGVTMSWIRQRDVRVELDLRLLSAGDTIPVRGSCFSGTG